MQLLNLHKGQLVRRYKRFLADIDTGSEIITAHCPNTGAMTGCAQPGWPVWYSLSDNPKRKYPATWELVETADGLCSVNTGRANKLVGEAITNGVMNDLGDVSTLRSETPIPDGGGRFDFSLSQSSVDRQIYVEVKSVTLCLGEGRGAFPDAVSVRAKKHVQALVDCVQHGDRGVLVFCAQHNGIASVCAADHIDRTYAEALNHALAAGVEVRAVACHIDVDRIEVRGPIEFVPVAT